MSPVSQEFQVGKIWPNPATEAVHVELQLSKPQVVHVEVHDLQGKWIKSFEPEMMMEGASSYKLEVADFSPGQYILKITSAHGLFANRILVKQ